jgi:site-specific DNA-methyltransferase (adenine-specific)
MDPYEAFRYNGSADRRTGMNSKSLRPSLVTNLGVLYRADCFDLLSALKDGTVDCVFADPPFNLGKDYGHDFANDDLEKKEYLRWSFEWIDACIRVLKPGGAMYIYMIPQWGFHLAYHLEERQMQFRHWIALSMKGTFPRGNKLYPAHYSLLYFTKGTPIKFHRLRLPMAVCRHCGKDIKDYGGHKKYLHPDGLSLTDLWDDTSPARHSKYKARWHINELKPMIPSRCIQISTDPGDIVLDPFGGGGSTYEAAQRLKRFWLGTEIGTCDPIRERFARAFPELKPGLPRKLAKIFSVTDQKFLLRRRRI